MQALIKTTSPEGTATIGERLGTALRAGDVVALFGDLGTGKTTLTRGIAKGLNVPNEVHSPTFTLIHEHAGETPLYHVDLYRLSGEDEVRQIGVEEYIEGTGVTIIEWADRHGIGPAAREARYRTSNDRRLHAGTDA